VGVGRLALLLLVLAPQLGPQLGPQLAWADDAAKIDWAKGAVIASGIGVADRQAPNPAVARGTSRRKAEDAARKAIAAALPSLLLATGGTLADKLTDAKVKERVDRAVAAAVPIDADPETDGAWRVRMAVPIEAVRQALTGRRELPAGGDTGPAVVIVEGVSVKPAVGYTIGGLSAGTWWAKDLPPWAKSAPRVKARAAEAGAIDVDVGKATESTLFVILAKS
jgi:hypothetical protein